MYTANGHKFPKRKRYGTRRQAVVSYTFALHRRLFTLRASRACLVHTVRVNGVFIHGSLEINMESKIANAIRMKYSPVAVVFTNEKPEGALEFTEGSRGCVSALMFSAAKGKTAVFSRKTYGCPGGGAGLGFGNPYKNFPGGIEYFLSTGNKEFCGSEIGKNIVKNMPMLVDGEGYQKTPEAAKKFIESLPLVDIPFEYVIYKPLENLSANEKPEIVVLLVNPDQLSALAVLANYSRGTDNVITRFGAGCQQTGIMAYKECLSDNPKAIIGLTDISVRKIFDKDILSFAMPYKMYLEMEGDVDGSFLQKTEWTHILERNK